MAKLGEANIGGRLVSAWLVGLTAEELDGLKWHSNTNLLDNWYFGNPVNQRGQTSYSGAVYNVDRWCGKWGGDMSAVLRNGYIEISRPNYAAHFRQYSDMSLAGKTVTLSALCSRINMFFESKAKDTDYTIVKNQITDSSDSISLLTFTTVVPTNSVGFCVALTSIVTNEISKVVAVKLELGDHQTLAHQDADGNWVLNEIPDYVEQLMRCQRYYIKKKIVVNRNGENPGYDVVHFPVEMANIPSIAIENVPGYSITLFGATTKNYFMVQNISNILQDMTYEAMVPGLGG